MKAIEPGSPTSFSWASSAMLMICMSEPSTWRSGAKQRPGRDARCESLSFGEKPLSSERVQGASTHLVLGRVDGRVELDHANGRHGGPGHENRFCRASQLSSVKSGTYSWCAMPRLPSRPLRRGARLLTCRALSVDGRSGSARAAPAVLRACRRLGAMVRPLLSPNNGLPVVHPPPFAHRGFLLIPSRRGTCPSLMSRRATRRG